MALTTKRIIALPSQNDPQEGDYLAIDNMQNGTHKIPVGRIGVEVDDTLTEQGKAADAKAVGDLKSDLQEITEETTSEGFDESDNLCDGLTLAQGYYGNDGSYRDTVNFTYLLIDVSGITKLKIDGTHHTYTTTEFNQLGVFKNDNDVYVDSVVNARGSLPASFPYEVDVPLGATKLYLNTDYTFPSSLPAGLVVYPWRTNVETIKVPYSALEQTPVALADLSQGDKKIKIIAGVIRNSGNGWEYINDAGHEPLNLTGISVNANGQIVIDYNFTASKVLSLVATPDETFASKYTIGGSVGLSSTVFNICSLPKTIGGLISVANNAVNVANSNFSSGELNTSTGEIRLYHDDLTGINAKEIFNVSAIGRNCNIRMGSHGWNYVSLYMLDNSGSIIKTITDGSQQICVSRQINSVFVNANNIVDAGGNFWIYGVMEI